MNLKCMINGKISGVFLPHISNNNKLLQGNTIAEDYSETLDSGSIILSDVEKIHNLDQYDDVFIWDCDVLPIFHGLSDVPLLNGHFYKHFLVDRFTEERNLLNKNNYTYKIELFSETKGLETIICPNIKITQPLDFSLRLPISTYMQHYLDLYSPKMKIKWNNANGYKEVPKYTLAQETIDMFKNNYCQEFSLNSPTLRELFAKLMITKDCIPMVKDNVIYPLCLSKTIGSFVLSNSQKSFMTAQKSSDDYVTQFRTNYSNALSSMPTCHRVEDLGFRNSDEAIMTINNMRLETSFPIYKLNKVYMKYWKKIRVNYKKPNNDIKDIDYYFLCKQDITSLCVLNNERQALYKDTRVASDKQNLIDYMRENYYFTVGYSIGSNLITGFGEMFNYIDSFGLSTWNKQECIIRNILNNIDALYPFGVDGEENISNEVKRQLELGSNNTFLYIRIPDAKLKAYGLSKSDPDFFETIPSIYIDAQIPCVLDYVETWLDRFALTTCNPIITPITVATNKVLIMAANKGFSALSGDSTVIKGLTFSIDYTGFYNGNILINKESFKRPIMKVDNQSESLPILELDGIAKERKINKMGNKMYTITARYKNWEDVQQVGTIFKINPSDENDENEDYEEEIIIYHREISIYDECINVTYYGQESFVLKNFYTSVFAKQRLFNVLDYGNSVTRAENIKDILFMSKTKYYNTLDKNLSWEVQDYLNFYSPTIYNPINAAYIQSSKSSLDLPKYVTDINTFTCGNSICFNVRMFDNITMGENIDPTHLAGKYWGGENNNDNYAGTTMNLCTIYDDYRTGRIERLNFYLGSKKYKDDALYVYDNTIEDLTSTLIGFPYQMTFSEQIVKSQIQNCYMPLIVDDYNYFDTSAYSKNQLKENVYVYKDANEIIDMTFQTQLMIDKKDRNSIFMSDMALKLSDLVGNIKKKNIGDSISLTDKVLFVPFQYKQIENIDATRNKTSLPGFIVRVPKEALHPILKKSNPEIYLGTYGFELKITNSKSDTIIPINQNKYISEWSVKISSLRFVDEQKIRVNCDYLEVKLSGSNNPTIITNYNTFFYLHLTPSTLIIDSANINENNYYYFTNIDFYMYNVPGAQWENKATYEPFLIQFYKDRETITDQPSWEVLTDENNNVVIPNDTNGANTSFWGYTGDGTLSPTETTISNFNVAGTTRYSFMYNYYDRSANDVCSMDNVSNKNLLEQKITMNDYEGIGEYEYPFDPIKVLSTLDDSNYSYEWTINSILSLNELRFDNHLYCVISNKEIESSLMDEKLSTISGDYEILTNNGEPVHCNDIFSVLYLNSKWQMNINLNKSYLENKLSNMKSIQEWIYNAKIGAYEFVCGFNISDEEKQNKNIKIYLTLAKDLDLQVFDDGILYGKIKNALDNNAPNVIPINDNQD